MRDEILVCIPSRRMPPLRTVTEFLPTHFRVLIISDPTLFDTHRAYFKNEQGIQVTVGREGMGAQSAACYEEAWKRGFPFFFRIDDDLARDSFTPEVSLYRLVARAREVMTEFDVSLVGFTPRPRNGVRAELTHRIVYGGANLARSAQDGSHFVDPRLVRYEDVYRTCAHREADPRRMIARVCDIRFRLHENRRPSVIEATQDQLEHSIGLVVDRFDGLVSRRGDRWRFHAPERTV